MEELTVHPVVPALVTAYEIQPLPDVVATVEGVAGEAVVSRAVVGAPVNVGVAALTVTVMVVVALL